MHQLLGATCFVLLPTLLMRTLHPDLCAHLLILWAIWLYLRPDGSDRPLVVQSAALALVAALVHPYLAVMVLALLAALAVRLLRVDRAAAVVILVTTVTATLVGWWLSGMFTLTGSSVFGAGVPRVLRESARPDHAHGMVDAPAGNSHRSAWTALGGMARPRSLRMSGVSRLSIVVPAYQEGGGIGASLRAIRASALSTGLDVRIVVVDDGSTDGTWAELLKAQSEMPEVGLVRLSRNFGKEAAISAGLDHVDGDACLLIDADLQHPPALIPDMVKRWREDGWDVVEAVKRSRGRESMTRRMIVRAFYGIVGGMTGQTLRDASDFKLLDKRVLSEWRRLGERATFFRGLVSWMGFRTTQVLFDVEPRRSGRSNWSLLGLGSLALRAITAFSALPLQMVTVLGSVMLLMALVLGAQALRLWLRGTAFPGFTTVILLQLIIGGFLMMSLGIIGTYIARIYDEVKARPRYIVQERAGTLVEARGGGGEGVRG